MVFWKSVVFSLLLFCFQLEGQGSRVLERYEFQKQYIQLTYHPESKEIEVEGKTGRAFARTQRRMFSVANDQLIDQSLMELNQFLTKNSFDNSFHELIRKNFEEFRLLNDRECRALFLSLTGPLASQDIDSLIEQLDQVGRFLEAPDDAVRSFDIEEFDLGSHRVGLRLYVNSLGQAVSLGLISQNKDFVGHRFQGSIKDGYSLFSPNGEWLLSLEVKNDAEITLKTIRPERDTFKESLLIDTKVNMTKLSLQAGSWQVDDGLLGVDNETFDHEWHALSRSLGIDQFERSMQEQLGQVFKHCRIYEDQRRSRTSIGQICELSVGIEVKLHEVLIQLALDKINPTSFKQQFRECLSASGVIYNMNEHSVLNSSYAGPADQVIDACLVQTQLPYKQDIKVLTLTDSNLGQMLLGREPLKLSFAQTLHEQAFQNCEKRKWSFDGAECQELIEKVANNLFVTTAISNFVLSERQIDHRQADQLRVELTSQWLECSGDYEPCFKDILEKIIDFKSSLITPDLSEFPVRMSLKVENYELFTDKLNQTHKECFSHALGRIQSLQQLILSYEELDQRCREKSQLESFSYIYSDYLRFEVFKNVFDLSPEFFSSYIEKQIDRFQNRVRNNEWQSVGQLSQSLEGQTHNIYRTGIAQYIETLRGEEFPLTGIGSSYANQALQVKWDDSIRKLLSIPAQESLENGIKRIFSSLTLEQSVVHANDLIKNVKKVTTDLSLSRDLMTKIQASSRRQDVTDNLGLEYRSCVDQFSSNQKDSNIAAHLNSCDVKLEAQVLFEQAKERFERNVSHFFALSSNKANSILRPIWDLSHCIQQQPHQSLEKETYLNRVQACIDLARMDISLNISLAQLENISPLLKDGQKEIPLTTAKSCYTSLLVQMASRDESLDKVINQNISYVHLRERSRSIMDIQTERFSNGRSLLSYVNRAQQSPSNTFAHSDSSKMMTLVRDLAANKDKFSPHWMEEEVQKCLKAVEEISLMAIRESFIENSPHFQNNQTNRVGETDAQVMRNILDNETIQLVLQMREHQEGFNLRAIVDPRERLMTREFTMDTLARSTEVISRYLGQGFIFDRDILKTELVIFRGELNEALRWMNSQEEPVAMKELADFFKSSELANILAIAEVSSQVQSRFLSFINQMEINELAEFNRRVGHRPESRLTQAQKDERQNIIDKHNALRGLSKEMTSSYDFRRIVMQDPKKGQELLDLIKMTSLIPQVAGQEVSPAARAQIWRKIGELILQDNTPGGFAERFVAQIAQAHLDQERESKWRITRWLFYNDGDFKWDTLRSTAAGRQALNYYGRYLLLPRVLDIPMSSYLKNLREEEFKRYLRRAQSEN